MRNLIIGMFFGILLLGLMGISKYPTENPYRPIAVSVPSGGKTAVVWPNGSLYLIDDTGKSTLIAEPDEPQDFINPVAVHIPNDGGAMLIWPNRSVYLIDSTGKFTEIVKPKESRGVFSEWENRNR